MFFCRSFLSATLVLTAFLTQQALGNSARKNSAAVPVPKLLPEQPSQTTDSILQTKLDSPAGNQMVRSQQDVDSAAKAKADSILHAIQAGQYVERSHYDMGNFDHWQVDTLHQQRMRQRIQGEWRTTLLAHGHAFRDASLRFGKSDTLYGTTRTYSDSGRYHMTGEYRFQARYRFENDSTIISREVFPDRNVVRWDHIRFKVQGNRLSYHLARLEFRDLNDNWLNAWQGFEHVEPEIYLRSSSQLP